MDETTKKALDLIEKGTVFTNEFINKHGPQAWETVLKVNQVQAMQTILYALFGLMFVVLLCLYARWYFKTMRANWEAWACRSSDGICHLPWVIPSGLALVVALVNLYTLSNIWLWTRLFKPELAIAYDMYTKLTN